MATSPNPESLQAVIADMRRTVAVAAWRHALIHIDFEARELKGRHAGTAVPLTELREHLIRLAAERHVPTQIG